MQDINIGDLVKVETKYYGIKLGLVVRHGMDGYFIQPSDHPRMILAQPEDCEIVSKHKAGE